MPTTIIPLDPMLFFCVFLFFPIALFLLGLFVGYEAGVTLGRKQEETRVQRWLIARQIHKQPEDRIGLEMIPRGNE